jgi:hypothetical protein
MLFLLFRHIEHSLKCDEAQVHMLIQPTLDRHRLMVSVHPLCCAEKRFKATSQQRGGSQLLPLAELKNQSQNLLTILVLSFNAK